MKNRFLGVVSHIDGNREACGGVGVVKNNNENNKENGLP